MSAPAKPELDKDSQAVLRLVGAGGLTVAQGLESTRREGVPDVAAARSISDLRDEGKLVIVDPHPPNSLLRYLVSPYAGWFALVFLAVVLGASSIYILPSVSPFVYVRYIVGSVMVLFLPGYALIEALYPKKGDLDGLERLALSVGLSLALVPLTGLALNYTPWGIRLDPIVASLSLLTLGLGLVAAQRKLGYLKLASGLRGGA